jgi:tetratricopeptide (TPR) repeat protein
LRTVVQGGSDEPAMLAPGLRLGAWEVVGPLGLGGMAEVVRARRADGAWEGLAAIKILKRGMDSSAVLQRFALEQRLLARLHHPHIATLLDAGRAPNGLPFFVMELVDGQPIDQACEGLALPARLGLFLQLADAVSFAHRQLLVHRDLKPSNVLVDREGQVKLLDFGIAKALDTQEGADPAQTAVGQRPFTPSFASPEQVRGEPIGTATDVYSLGVLLYVMLTGLRPYGRDATSSREVMRSVLGDAPTRPSALAEGLVTDPRWAQIRRQLRGDLDNILMKALEKPPERRYASVDALAEDIRAHLDGRPVSAHPPSWVYLASRFVGRHRWGVAAGFVAVSALVGGTGVALWQARLAGQERAVAQQRFKQVRELANQLVFKYHDQMVNLPGATKVREALLVDAAAFLDSLHQAAADDPQLAHELANTYYRISRLQGVARSVNTGQHELAQANLDKAIALTRRYVDRPEVPVTTLAEAVNMRTSLAEQWQRLGQMQRADAAMQDGQPLLDRALARNGKDTAALTSAIAFHGVRSRIQASLVHAGLGQWRDACRSADQSREAAQATLVADPANVYGPDSLAFALGEQGQCQLMVGRADAAETLFAEQMALCDRNAQRWPEDMDFRLQRAIVRANRARALAAIGRLAEARQWLDQALVIGRAVAEADSTNAAASLQLRSMAVVSLQLQVMAGELAQARNQAETVLAQLPATAASSFIDTRWRAEALIWAARAWRAAQPAQALALAEQAQVLMQPARADDDNATRRWMLALAQGESAQALAALGDKPQAREVAAAALKSWQPQPADPGPPPLLQPWLVPVRALAAH